MLKICIKQAQKLPCQVIKFLTFDPINYIILDNLSVIKARFLNIISPVTKIVIVLLMVLVLPQVIQASEKTDTVYLKNGDRITGEVKRLEYGILFLKTSGLGTINIEFDRIKTFYAKDRFTIMLASGLRFFGTIDTSGMEGYVILRVNDFRIPEPISEIAELYPVKNAFWKRLDGSVDLGYSYTKASTVSQLDFSGNLEHRVEKAFTQIKAGFTMTDQQDRDRIRKQDYAISYKRIIKRKWFAAGALGMQQNTELGLEHRYWGGPAAGNNLVNNNLHVLSTLGGVMFTTELSAEDSITRSIEGLMQVDYRIFKFNKPDIDVRSSFSYYPSLTSWGRHRIDFSINAKFEIFNDFYFGLRLYDNFDSKPVDATAETNDWGVTTSIGYSW